MNDQRLGKTFHLLLAIIMTGSVIMVAILLNSMSTSTVVPAIAVINTDYQVESAMIMQMQKSHNTSLEQLRVLHKEIMPGVFLQLESNSSDGQTWNFAATVKGHGLERNISAMATLNRPDQLIFLNSKTSN